MAPMEAVELGNREQAEAWNGDEGAYWAVHQERWDAVNGGVNDALFAAAAIGERDQVLDVGCGNGQTTRLAARRAPRGQVLGIDLSSPMLERARATAATEGVVNVRFQHGDAQVYPFPTGAFDLAISRFGVMFFADPVAAFANIGRALRPGGRLAFVCMRDLRAGDLGPVFAAIAGHVARESRAAAAPSAGPDTSDAESSDGGLPSEAASGALSLADPARIRGILARAGFVGTTVAPIQVPMRFGRDAADAAVFLLGTEPVRALLARADSTSVASARDALTAAFAPYQTPDGVQLRGADWLVSATRPARPTQPPHL